jgi:hypothetical protein
MTNETTRIATFNHADGMFHLHREGCSHTKTADFKWLTEGRDIGIYDSVLEAVEGILDEEIQEMGYGLESLEVAACCKAKAADFATRQ